mmetsp:Transcript_11977/g.31705  ORF Transcript_11977/g.31705 Transcript_11977/m.31705 type:complete len:265 (+) Transcript_11977:556-1350(+)
MHPHYRGHSPLSYGLNPRIHQLKAVEELVEPNVPVAIQIQHVEDDGYLLVRDRQVVHGVECFEARLELLAGDDAVAVEVEDHERAPELHARAVDHRRRALDDAGLPLGVGLLGEVEDSVERLEVDFGLAELAENVEDHVVEVVVDVVKLLEQHDQELFEAVEVELSAVIAEKVLHAAAVEIDAVAGTLHGLPDAKLTRHGDLAEILQHARAADLMDALEVFLESVEEDSVAEPAVFVAAFAYRAALFADGPRQLEQLFIREAQL